jgi:hypothetical protein
MRIDTYMKAAFTLIALSLTAIAVRSWTSPDSVAHAQAPSPELQFAATPVGYSFFDARTGDLWEYSGTGIHGKFKLTKPGMPLVKEK